MRRLQPKVMTRVASILAVVALAGASVDRRAAVLPRGEKPRFRDAPGGLASPGEVEATGGIEAMRIRYQLRASAGPIAPDALLRGRQHIEAMPAVAAPHRGQNRIADGGVWSWEWLGPGNIGGRIRSILVHPADPNVLFVGSVSGGIWRSNNAGASWQPVDDFLATLSVSSLAVDPTNSSVMYAGTGEGFDNGDALPGHGIFKSTDGGVTWSQLASTAGWGSVNRVAHHPTAANTLYAATPSGIYKSTTGGAFWTWLLPAATLDLDICPTNASDMIASGIGILDVTTDGGATWSNRAAAAGSGLPTDGGRFECAFSGTTMYASVDRNFGELYRSTNLGSTWTARNTTTNYFRTGIAPDYVSQGSYDNALWVSPVNSDFLIVGGIDLYRSTDGGTTLTQISDWREYHHGLSAHADQHAIVAAGGFNGTTNKRVYFGNDGGIQTAADITTVGTTSGWTNLANGLGITQFYCTAAAADGSRIVAGAQDNDALRYSVGTTWYQAKTGDAVACAVEPNNPSILYEIYPGLRVYKSTNGGDSYFVATNGLTEASDPNAPFLNPMVMDPNNSSTLYVGGGGVWKTTDGGANWTGLGGFGAAISALAVARGNSAIVWAGTFGGRVVKSVDGGINWYSQDDNGATFLPNRAVTDIEISPRDVNVVAVTFSGYAPDDVWLTLDGGNNWQRRTGSGATSLPSIQVNCIAFSPFAPTWLYAGTDLAILVSEDLGVTWNKTPACPVGDGPVNVEVDDLVWYQDRLLAATHGRGLFRCRPLAAVWVDATNNTGVEDGTAAHPYNTVREGIAASGNGTVMVIAPGTYADSPVVFDRRQSIVNSGPVQVR